MGRPPIGPAVLIRLEPAQLARIDAIVGDRGRPGFIRDAVARELERRERDAADTQS